jgi:hypothetical protein
MLPAAAAGEPPRSLPAVTPAAATAAEVRCRPAGGCGVSVAAAVPELQAACCFVVVLCIASHGVLECYDGINHRFDSNIVVWPVAVYCLCTLCCCCCCYCTYTGRSSTARCQLSLQTLVSFASWLHSSSKAHQQQQQQQRHLPAQQPCNATA